MQPPSLEFYLTSWGGGGGGGVCGGGGGGGCGGGGGGGGGQEWGWVGNVLIDYRHSQPQQRLAPFCITLDGGQSFIQDFGWSGETFSVQPHSCL